MQDNALLKDDAYSLGTAQRAFSTALFDNTLPHPDDVVGPAEGKKALKRFSVYRNNVMVSLTEALMAAYPTIFALVGEDFFRAMAPNFITANPPQSAMLMEFGGGFGDFLDRFEPVSSLPFLGDVARLEEAWLKAYHAADQEPLDPAKLQTVAPEDLGNLTFSFHASTHILGSQHATYSIWAAHKEADVEGAMAGLVHAAEDILITRPQWEVNVIKLPAGAFVFISALMEGYSLAAAAETAAKNNPDFDFAQNLGGLLETGALLELQPPQKP